LIQRRDRVNGDAVHSVDAGIVRWAKAYTGSSSWSCYGNSIAIGPEQRTTATTVRPYCGRHLD